MNCEVCTLFKINRKVREKDRVRRIFAIITLHILENAWNAQGKTRNSKNDSQQPDDRNHIHTVRDNPHNGTMKYLFFERYFVQLLLIA